MAGPSKGSMGAEPDVFLETIGIKIREARQRAGLSAAQVAELTGSNKAWVYSVEVGTQNFQIQGIRRLLQVLGLELRDVLPSEGDAASYKDQAARVHEVTSKAMLQLGLLTTALNELRAVTAPLEKPTDANPQAPSQGSSG